MVVCPTPIGNLEDITLRVLAALREADVVACEDTRHTRVLLERYGVSATLVSYHEHNERARAARAGRADARRRRSSRWSATPACRWCRDPGSALVQGCVAAGLAVEVLPGPVRARSPRWSRARCPSDVWRFAGFLPRKRRPLEAVFARAGDASSRSSRRGASAPRSAVLAELDPERPVAVCRELTKLHEEIVRGTAPELAARYAAEDAARRDRARRRRRARAPTGLDPAAVEAVARWSSPAPRAKTAAKVVAELTGAPANALYRAVAT